MVDINITNFITVGLLALVFLVAFKFVSRKAGFNIGI